MTMNYHKPVLLDESVEGLNIQPGKTYIDVTYGGGGHAKKILEKLEGGQLIAFDQDEDARGNWIEDERLIFVKGNFRYLKNYLKYYQAFPCDGILADLGISSHQIDDPARGFSTRYDGPLDFRMNTDQQFTGEDLVNDYSPGDLMFVLKNYGEIKNAKALAKGIVKAREEERLSTIEQFKKLVEKYAPRYSEHKYLAKVFQAIRIEVNQEMQALKQMLMDVSGVLKPGGRLVVISYHSLEDRLVKNLIRAGNLEGTLDKDFYGNVKKPFEAINRKPIVPSEEEIARNPRARSAKLRIAQKVENDKEE
ncbi:MAG: 16S rRNA (cytosine(1402)-N(4))-methyltransferase RsmH [Bacteroidales bacterium]|nr:16S rRNA (cytosine(1402)-N(4))-methyltransferase RsmH [Bacteroidales bacterium]MCF8327209.1 16S rRNA (cytosine(1402)-N(4))-methyltransferase RsmH [Bacteroidales bacterium]